ncbi:hypothetical protein ID866_6085 [Astraeus odoratus]|nr:hypothetical protein ID866_6085 [Astraeus odoratus]
MSRDCTPLVLDDIVHVMSPSPAPQPTADDSEMTLRANSSSPEPLLDSDLVHMRKRVLEMHILDKGELQASPREKELAKMVLRFTNSPILDTEQLVRQAEMISALTVHRDMLLQQAEEQRLRWESEKDGWARIAEALIAQQTKNRPSAERDDDIERLNTNLETDNKNLRQRLHETQSRLQLLETELTRLRPLLVMQPPGPSTTLATPRAKHQMRKRRKDANQPLAGTEDEAMDVSDDDTTVPGSSEFGTPTHSSQLQNTPRSKSRRSEAYNATNPTPSSTHTYKRRSLKSSSRGLSADARVEHLLLAARRLGKERVSAASGMIQQMEDRDGERRREDSTSTAVATTPKTPKRVAAYPGYMPAEGGYIYVNSPVRPAPGMQAIPVFIPAYPRQLLQTPTSSTTAASATSSKRPEKQSSQTPLDSLLSAARSMMREGGREGLADVDRQAQDDDVPPDSPLPKRRRVGSREKAAMTQELASSSNTSTTDGRGSTSAPAGRVRSALDVLADQAAAFSVQDATTRATPVQNKGKGKDRTEALEVSASATKTRERSRSRRRDVGGDASPSRSRSRTPVAPPTSAKHGAASKAPGDPGGRSQEASASQYDDPSILSPILTEQDKQRTEGGGTSRGTLRSPTDHSQDTDKTPTQLSSSVVTKLPARAHPRSQSPSPPTILHSSKPPSEPQAVTPPRAGSVARASSRAASPLDTQPRGRSGKTAAAALPSSETSGPGAGSATADSSPVPMAVNKHVFRVAGQDGPAQKRPRSPYVKWTKEEDELLAQAVAKYGQKWDLVQKALPSRGYHQVRQRWLRKLGVFDSKPDLTTFQTSTLAGANTPSSEPPPNPKLGLAPLSSELAFSSLTDNKLRVMRTGTIQLRSCFEIIVV